MTTEPTESAVATTVALVAALADFPTPDDAARLAERARQFHGAQAGWGFQQHSRAWYRASAGLDAYRPERIMIGLYANLPAAIASATSGPSGDARLVAEFAVEWRALDDATGPSPRVGLFDDAWQLIPLLPEFLLGLTSLATFAAQRPRRAYAPAPSVTPQEVVALLLRLGMTDLTAEQRRP